MKIYNTLTRKKEEFIPIEEKKVGIYACGPTVYDYIHVGNARPMVVFDTLRRFFEYEGYDVDFVVNFTDIDDKIINKAIEQNVQISEITEKYINAYLNVAEELNVKEEDTIHPRATDYVEGMISFIEGLVKKDAAYNVDGNVYFRVDKAEDYGKLSGRNIADLKSGARVEINEEKENSVDFGLWKKAKEGEPYWESPWGKGRPGWHIECSVMSRDILGDTIDIHAGGEDLQFPHHENEIAQSETLTEKTFANYWMHNGMLTIDDRKMSKSEGNFFTVEEIREEFDLEVLRYFLISSHYRTPINFSRDIMEQMKNALERLYNGKKNLEYLLEKSSNHKLDKKTEAELEKIDEFKENFILNMRDDLNTAAAISELFDLVRYVNQNMTIETSKKSIERAYKVLLELSNILGILQKEDELLDDEIQELIDKRTEARENKDFALSDKIRDDLIEKGIHLEDTAEGVKWRRL